MLLATRSGPYSHPGGLFELRMDGSRVPALCAERIQLLSRHGTDLTEAFPGDVAALRQLQCGTASMPNWSSWTKSDVLVFTPSRGRAWRHGVRAVAESAKHQRRWSPSRPDINNKLPREEGDDPPWPPYSRS